MIKKIFHIILVFNLIFAPVYPIIENGIVLSLIISALYLCRSREALLYTNEFFRNRYIKMTIILPILVIVAIFLIALLHFEKLEFAYAGNYIGLIITAVSAFLVSSIIYLQNGRRLVYVIDLILVCFSVQTVIIVLAQINPAVLKFVQFFQSEALLNLHREPLFRRLLLSSAGFYGIGLVYGLTYIILAHKLIETKKITLMDFIHFILLFIGNMYTARTGFVGLLFAVFYIAISRGKEKFRIFLKFSSLLVFFIIIGLLVLPKNIAIFDEKVIGFAFEMFVNEKLETGSSNGLKTMWNRDISLSTFFIGDGVMYNNDGSYYMRTDVGYLRNIFFGGILFFLLLFTFHVYIIVYPLYDFKRMWPLILTLILYSLALHVKGEAIMFSRVLMSEMYLFLFILYYDLRKNNVNGEKKLVE